MLGTRERMERLEEGGLVVRRAVWRGVAGLGVGLDGASLDGVSLDGVGLEGVSFFEELSVLVGVSLGVVWTPSLRVRDDFVC